MDMAAQDRRSSTGTDSNPLLKDLHEKKQNLRRIASEVGSMASELRDVRSRMVAQDMALSQETARRQSAEARVRSMEHELILLQKSFEDRSIEASQTSEQQDNRRAQSGSGKCRTDATSGLQHPIEIGKKSEVLQEDEKHILDLERQVGELQQDLTQMGVSQKHLREELERLQLDMKRTVAKSITSIDSEFKRLLEENSLKNAEQLAKHVTAKDEEISRLKEEAKLTSTHLKFKAQDLEVQLEKQRRTDQDLKNRVIKLELWLQETRSQTRKLQRIAEKRGKEIEDLRAALRMEISVDAPKQKSKPWDVPRLKILLSVSVVVLAFLAKH